MDATVWYGIWEGKIETCGWDCEPGDQAFCSSGVRESRGRIRSRDLDLVHAKSGSSEIFTKNTLSPLNFPKSENTRKSEAKVDHYREKKLAGD